MATTSGQPLQLKRRGSRGNEAPIKGNLEFAPPEVGNHQPGDSRQMVAVAQPVKVLALQANAYWDTPGWRRQSRSRPGMVATVLLISFDS